MQSLLQRIDIFGSSLPAFNLKGQTMVHTISGGVATFLVIVVMLIYGSIKIIHLFSKHNPNVVSVYEKNYFDYKERLDLNQIDFRLAFSVEGYHDRLFKNNPEYVKYFA